MPGRKKNRPYLPPAIEYNRLKLAIVTAVIIICFMKAAYAIASMLLVSGLPLTAAPKLATGADKSEIYRQMGPPDGILELPSKTVLLYETAELTLVDNVLFSASWKTEEEVALETAHKEKAIADWARYQETLEADRHERGVVILARKQIDAGFKASSGRKQARFWRDFVRDYPSVNASEEYQAAVVLAQTEAQEARKEALLVAEAQAQQTPRTTTTSLIDTVDIGGYAYNNYYRPYTPTVVAISPSNTVVIGGGGYGYCPPTYQQPILNVGYRSDNFSIRYNSGGGYSRRPCIYPQPSPIIIVNP